MRNFFHLSIGALMALTGCATHTRISEYPMEFATLDPATQQNIKHGVVAAGYTTEMVYMALGRPAQTTTDGAGDTIWTYYHEPVTGPNEPSRTASAGGPFMIRKSGAPISLSNGSIPKRFLVWFPIRFASPFATESS
jgi:hypothetical protein